MMKTTPPSLPEALSLIPKRSIVLISSRRARRLPRAAFVARAFKASSSFDLRQRLPSSMPTCFLLMMRSRTSLYSGDFFGRPLGLPEQPGLN
jgi:hypothetical protein